MFVFTCFNLFQEKKSYVEKAAELYDKALEAEDMRFAFIFLL